MSESADSPSVVRTVSCGSWEDFRQKLQAVYIEESNHSYLVFRGQADPAWRLASHWERQLADSSVRGLILKKAERDQQMLTKFLIPGSAIPRALTELRMMNITYATLFPDFEGAARQANFEAVASSLMALSVADSDI